MMFLENVLAELNDRANVCIMLSSYTVYGIGDGETDNPLRMQDGVGNYRASTWLEALQENMTKQFTVLEVSCAFESYMDRPQWTITLECGKDKRTEALYLMANDIAIAKMWD